jgi:hypothetical protein
VNESSSGVVVAMAADVGISSIAVAEGVGRASLQADKANNKTATVKTDLSFIAASSKYS